MSCELLQVFAGTDPWAIRLWLPDLSAETLHKARSAAAESAVWVVAPDTGEALAGLQGTVDDRGTKHPDVELARPLLKGDGSAIPLIRWQSASGDPSDTSPARLFASTRSLLKKVPEGRPRLFLVAVSQALFAELRKTARESAGVRVFRGPNGAVLNLLEPLPEPPKLREAFVGRSADAAAVRQLILRAAQADATVLVSGDSGTGKEIVARQIHQLSGRSRWPFRAVNCSALPGELFESELFGFVKGAHSTATMDRMGLWEAANRGTLFLDEIGDIAPNHQAKMLRALQERQIRRVGGVDEIELDVRVICATNRDLFSMVQAGQFREDLYYRLRGFPISTAPLREHPEDIPDLANASWARIAGKDAQPLGPDILAALSAHAWPGNVRVLNATLAQLFTFFGQMQPIQLRFLQAIFETPETVQAAGHNTAPAERRLQDRLTVFKQLRMVYETVCNLEWRFAEARDDDGWARSPHAEASVLLGSLIQELNDRLLPLRGLRLESGYNLSLLSDQFGDFYSRYRTDPQAALASLRDERLSPLVASTLKDILEDIARRLEGLSA